MTRLYRHISPIAVCALTVACGPVSPPKPPQEATPTGFGGADGQAVSSNQCVVPKGDTEPFVVEWGAAKRNKVKQLSADGALLAVHSGCGLKFLDGCNIGEGYDTVEAGGDKIADSFDIGSVTQLKTKLPIGYFELYGKFQKGDRWTLNYVFADSKKAKINTLKRSELPPHCSQATHFVSRIMLGAYRLRAAAARAGGAGVGVKGAGITAESGSDAENIREGGDFEVCNDTGTESGSEACQAIVQIYLREIQNDVSPPTPEPPPGPNGQTVPDEWTPKTSLTPDYGWLKISSNYTNVAVLVDGIEVGKTPLKNEIRLAAGKHAVAMQHDCLHPKRMDVAVAVGTSREVDIELTPREGAVAVLPVDQNGRPVKAEVLLAGKSLGTTSGRLQASVYKVSACMNGKKLEVRAKGYKTFAQNVKIEDRKTTDVQVELRAEAPSVAGLQWISINGGKFLMGSNDGDDDEKPPPHWVTVPSFEMLKTEVTVDQYKACSGCSKPKDKSDSKYCNWGYGDRGSHPINCVDWAQAGAFCRSIGGRLPSEAEWEYAARSGGQDRKYPWGDETVTCDYAVMEGNGNDGCGKDRTWPVCSKTRGNTDQGLCDMAGNVWEWVEDKWHDSYNGAPTDGAAWTSGSEEKRVLRGGSWGFDNVAGLRAAYRDRRLPSDWVYDFGFRCVRSSR